MTLKIIIPVAFALSTDAFAVSIAKGTRNRERSVYSALRIGALFGGFEAAMCAAGWMLASLLGNAIRSLDHWIALTLLCGVGLKMIFEAWGAEGAHPEETEVRSSRSPLLWLITALGTSIDAAAIGIAFAFSGVAIWLAVPVIGLVSGSMSALGYVIAPSLGVRFGHRAEIVGGATLILIGALIFWSHQFGGLG